jgi:hypothetical protein
MYNTRERERVKMGEWVRMKGREGEYKNERKRVRMRERER